MLLPADITPARRCKIELAAVPEGASRLLRYQRLPSGRPTARETLACVQGSSRTGHESAHGATRKVGQCSVESLGQRGSFAPPASVSTLRTSSWSRSTANDAAYLIGNAGNLHEILEATSSRSCAVACRLPEARRLRRRHVWRGTSLAGKCSLPYISRVGMIRWSFGFSELCPQRSPAPLQSHRSA